MFNTDRTDPAFDASHRPENKPDLCHKCGRCCRSATTYHSHEKLQAMADAGEEDARDFLEVFEPFASHEQARQVVPEQVDHVLAIAAQREDMDPNEVTFYHCRYVTEEGLCGIYERRPRFCQDAPFNGWAAMPPGCGFEGWQFYQRESHKHDIRKLKELQYRMTLLSPDGVHTASGESTLETLNQTVEDKLKPWQNFGASQW